MQLEECEIKVQELTGESKSETAEEKEASSSEGTTPGGVQLLNQV